MDQIRLQLCKTLLVGIYKLVNSRSRVAKKWMAKIPCPIQEEFKDLKTIYTVCNIKPVVLFA